MAREFKDSGIEWIGQIPKEWDVVQVKNLLDISRGRVIPITEMDDSYMYPVFSSQTKNNGCMGFINTYDYNGDALTWTTDGANAGTMFYRTGRFNCTNVCGILQLKPLKIQSSIKYLLYSIGYSAINCRRLDINGYKIMSNEMAVIQFVYPTFSEQQKIADYLDKVCGEVDEMVTLQETMIEELKAYKQSIITEAVTKGLNPNVPMRDSGIDWIGEIPEHWSTTKIKKIARTNSGSTPRNISDGENSNIVWIRTTDINDDVVYDSSLHLTSEEYSSASCPMLDEGTCVVAMYGGGGTIGKSGMLGVKATINQALCSMEVGDSFTGDYLFCILRSVRYYWMKYAVGTRKDPNINQEIVRNLIIPVPPLNEQRAIASYLNTKCSEIDSLIALKQAKIEELKEYKKSIIYEYVTGKKEVC